MTVMCDAEVHAADPPQWDWGYPPGLVACFDPLARMVATTPTVLQILDKLTGLAAATAPGCTGAAVSTIRPDGRTTTLTRTNPIPARADALQHAYQQGPGLTAVRDHTTVRVDDLATEERWPRYAPATAALGIAGMWAYPLCADGPLPITAAFVLYAHTPNALDTEAAATGAILAAHANTALRRTLSPGRRYDAMPPQRTVERAVDLLTPHYPRAHTPALITHACRRLTNKAA